MRAMRLQHQAAADTKPLRLEEVPDPSPGPGEVRVRVITSAICRTDLHIMEGDLPARLMPVILGHQVVGIVDALGPGPHELGVGDRIGIAWLRGTCGTCRFCHAGRENLCPGSRYTGYHVDGGFAELAVIPEAFAYRIPASLPARDAAPLLCAGIIGHRALSRSAVPASGRLGLYGFGSSAHIVLQMARHRGCRVFVATRGAAHRTLARRLGAEWAGEAAQPMPEALDSAILFAPAGDLVPIALRAVRPGGTVAIAGIHLSRIPALDYEESLFHEKTLTSVEANTRADGLDLLREAAAIPIRPRTTSFRLEEANEALVRLKHGEIEGTGVLVVGLEA
jgi:propanol-preferring alcohol dehydrogenase